MISYSAGNVSAQIHFAVSYCVVGEPKRTAIDYGTAALDIEREVASNGQEEILTRLMLRNTSEGEIRLMSAYPIMTDDLKIGEMPSWDWQVLSLSRQLNDVPASCFLGERDASFYEMFNRLGDEGLGSNVPLSGDAVSLGDGITVIKAGKTYVSLEVLSNDNLLTDIGMSIDLKGDVKAVRIGGEFSCVLGPYEIVYTDWVRIKTGGNFIRIMDDYAQKRAEMCLIRRTPQKKSTYVIDGTITHEGIIETVSFLKCLKAPFDYIELGNGWQSAIGDWEDRLDINCAYAASLINRTEYKAGIWTAPFLVERGAELLETERKWILRHGDGSACTYEVDGQVYAVLDISDPDCLEWIEMMYTRLCAQGFYMHHIDHTIAFAIQKDVVMKNKKMSIAKAYRNAMRRISEAVGEDSCIYVTNGFLPCLDGVADCVQVTSDVETMKKRDGGNTLARLVNQGAYRAYMSQWWHNLGGVMVNGNIAQMYPADELKHLLVCQYINTAPALVTGVKSNEQLKFLKYIYPCADTTAYPRNAFCDSAFIDVVDVEVRNSYHTLCFFNNSFAEVDLSFRLDGAICGGYVDHASQYNVSTYFGKEKLTDCKCDEIIHLGKIPANSCEIVKISKTDKPQVILTDMHFSMGGELEVVLDGDCVKIDGCNHFNCRGNYVISLPKDMKCADGRREFSLTVNGEGSFHFEKQIIKL